MHNCYLLYHFRVYSKIDDGMFAIRRADNCVKILNTGRQ